MNAFQISFFFFVGFHRCWSEIKTWEANLGSLYLRSGRKVCRPFRVLHFLHIFLERFHNVFFFIHSFSRIHKKTYRIVPSMMSLHKRKVFKVFWVACFRKTEIISYIVSEHGLGYSIKFYFKRRIFYYCSFSIVSY